MIPTDISARPLSLPSSYRMGRNNLPLYNAHYPSLCYPRSISYPPAGHTYLSVALRIFSLHVDTPPRFPVLVYRPIPPPWRGLLRIHTAGVVSSPPQPRAFSSLAAIYVDVISQCDPNCYARSNFPFTDYITSGSWSPLLCGDRAAVPVVIEMTEADVEPVRSEQCARTVEHILPRIIRSVETVVWLRSACVPIWRASQPVDDDGSCGGKKGIICKKRS